MTPTSMYKIALFAGILLCSWRAPVAVAQKTPITNSSTQKLWVLLDSLVKQELPLQAEPYWLELKARIWKAKSTPDALKLWMVGMKLNETRTEESLKKYILQLDNELPGTWQPLTQIGHSVLARLYGNWYQQNLYQLVQYHQGDEWSREAVVRKIVDHYRASVSDAEYLKQQSVERHLALLEAFDQPKAVRPTLYDVLMQEAFEGLRNSNLEWEPSTSSAMADARWWLPASDFVQLELDARVTGTRGEAYRLLQEWVRFRLSDTRNPVALSDLERLRMRSLRTDFEGEGIDSLYYRALQQLISTQPASTVMAQLLFDKAYFMYEKGSEWFPGSGKHHANCQSLEVAREVVARFPKSSAACQARSFMQEIEAPFVEMKGELVWLPNQLAPLSIAYRNVKQVQVQIFRVNKAQLAILNSNPDSVAQILVDPLWSKKIDLPDFEDKALHAAGIELPVPQPGTYVWWISASDAPPIEVNKGSWMAFQASRLAGSAQFTHSPNLEMLVVDRGTGVPMQGVGVEVVHSEYPYVEIQPLHKGVTDKDGFVSFEVPSSNGSIAYWLTKDDDRYEGETWWHSRNEPDGGVWKHMEFFTDRKIYRPGQTIRFKAILFSGEKQQPLAGERTEIVLRDPNGKEQSRMELVTNVYGSVWGSFVFPQEGLRGSWSLSHSKGHHAVAVESYKRPSFEIEWEPFSGVLLPGTTAALGGKALGFAGNGIAHATVQYKIQRQPAFVWRCTSFAPEWVTAGTLGSDSTGRFQLTFEVPPMRTYHHENYLIAVEVIGPSGETQSAETHFQVSAAGVHVSVESDREQWANRPLAFRYRVENSNQVAVSWKGTFALRRIEYAKPLLPLALWERPDTMLSGGDRLMYGNEEEVRIVQQFPPLEVEWKGGGTFNFPLDELKPGWYEWEYRTTDASGKPLTVQNRIWVLDDRPCESGSFDALQLQILTPKAKTCQWLKFATASGYADAHVLVEVAWANGSQSKKWITLNRALAVDSFAIPDKSEGKAMVSATLLIHNRLYQNHVWAQVEEPDRELQLMLTTWRNNTLPGSMENWTLRVLQDSVPMPRAEVLLTLYDASLDAFAPNRWTWPGVQAGFYYRPRSWSGFGLVQSGSPGYFNAMASPCALGVYPMLRWFGYDPGGRNQLFEMAKSNSGIQIRGMAAVRNKVVEEGDLVAVNDERVPDEPFKWRSDFSETAFFYPDHLTDANGKVNFSFTLPHRVSVYRFLALAHTASGAGGHFSADLVVQKKVMVQPNLPRFVRQGDRLVFRAAIASVLDKEVKGTAQLEILDAATQKPLNAIGGKVAQQVELPAGGTRVVQWTVTIPANLSAIRVRTRFDVPGHSDGEEAVVPVLPSEVVVDESYVQMLYQSGKQRVVYPHFKTGRASAVLTFAYSASMEQEVLKALPLLMEAPSDGAEQLLSRGFGYAVGLKLTESERVKLHLQRWANQAQELKSPLEEANSGHNVLLSETPWVAQADREGVDRCKLIQLLNPSLVENSLQHTWGQLAQFQLADGAFPWYAGMTGSRYMTQHVAATLGQLSRIAPEAVGGESVRQIVSRLLPYLHRQLALDAKHALADTVSGHAINPLTLHLLYARSFFEPALPDSLLQPWLTRLSAPMQGLGVVEKSLAALFLSRNGKIAQAQYLMQSVRENLVHPSDGLAFVASRGFQWNTHSLEAQALVLMAFNELFPNDSDAVAMRNWLITQKQTRAWPSTKSTTLAVAAVCTTTESMQPSTDQIRVGKRKWVLSDTLQSVAAQWSGKQITASLGKADVVKTGTAPAFATWNCVHVQPLDEVQQASSGNLAIDRVLFVERPSETGAHLVPVEQTILKVGDVIRVRLLLKAGADLDFVQVRDLRASALEPSETLSGYRHALGMGYYQTFHDASAEFYIDHLPKGNHVLEYRLRVNQSGMVHDGFARIQCVYAPEFKSHSNGSVLSVP